MCFLAFTGFFRIEELLSVQLKDVIFLDTHIDIVLDKSKCDQHREGHIVPIARLDSMYCPVKVLEKFLRLCNVDKLSEKDFFIIPRLFSNKNGQTASRNKGISYTRAREVFLKNLKSFNVESHNYCLHSLRSGGASSAANNNVSDRLISKHGRWKSDKSRDGYIKDSKDSRLQITKSLGL